MRPPEQEERRGPGEAVHAEVERAAEAAPRVEAEQPLKAGVTRAHRYEPDINPTYADLARHYGFAVLPARPRRPRDKGKVEVGVLLAERWTLAALRHQRFTRLGEVEQAVKPLLEKLTARPMRKPGKSRRELFEEVERAVLGGRRVASHVRSAQKGRFTTQPEHMPKSHRQHAQWTPSRIIRWAQDVGPH